MATPDAARTSNARDGIGLSGWLATHRNITFRHTEYALFQDAAVQE